MKLLKRISLFVLYPVMMFSLGFAGNMVFMEYFYPGDVRITAEPQINTQTEIQTGQEPGEGLTTVSVTDGQIITANTEILVQKYDAEGSFLGEENIHIPDKYIGMSREAFEEELKAFNQTPPLNEMQLGLSYVELFSFSPQRIVIKKVYSMADSEEENGFFLVNENHRVVVYQKDLQNVYMNTDIQVEDLPESLQEEIIKIKYVEDEKELYNFLESYSS